MLLLLAIALLVIFFLPVKDTDFGWHYRCGKLFFTQAKLCLSNDFSYFLPDYHWAYPSFIYNLTLAAIFDRFGFIGVSLWGSLIFSLVFMIFLTLNRGPLWLNTFITFLIIGLNQNIFSLGYRSQILGLLFFMLTLSLLGRENRMSRNLFFLPLLFLIWANSHPSFFLGPLTMGLFLLDKAVSCFNKKYDYRPLAVLFLTFAISLGFTAVNPFGLRIYQEVWIHFQAPLNRMIAEWVPPPQWQQLLIASLTATALILALKHKQFNYRFLLLLIFTYLALIARRNLPLYYLTVFVVILNQIDLRSFLKAKRRFLENALVTLLFILLVATASLRIPKTVKFDLDYAIYCQDGLVSLPCAAVDRLRSKTGRIFNSYEWGGFLIWQLPQMQVFVDGRMPAWRDSEGKSPYAVFLEIIQAQPGWDKKLEQYGTEYLLIGPGTFLDLALREDKGTTYPWQEEYRDQAAVIYRRAKQK